MDGQWYDRWDGNGTDHGSVIMENGSRVILSVYMVAERTKGLKE